jgi:glycosyltransferase involved in cell wall biosynthesis
MGKRPLVSILVPAFNEEDNVERTHAEITRVFDGLPEYDHEIVFTDNHSTDRTFALLSDIARRDPRVRVIRFARNYGYQRSLLVAYQNARGDCSVQVDCDLQDPPSLIPEMLARWREGHQVVYGIRRSLADGPVTTAMRRVYYYLVNALSEDELPVNAGEFRLVDGRLLAELRKVSDTSPYLRGLISSMGYSQVGLEYDRGARVAGESKFPLSKMISLGLDGVLNHSLIPLRMASGIGMLVGVCTLLLLVGYLAGRVIFGQNWPAGFATTTLLLLLGITLNALFLGIIGEYLGRIFQQVKERPRPIVEAIVDGGRRLDSLSREPEPVEERPAAEVVRL